MTRNADVEAEERAKRSLDKATYDRLVPLVRRTVTRLAMQGDDLQASDLGAWAWLGVIEAARRDGGDLDDSEIEAYALFRARSALLDAISREDPTTHLARSLSIRLVGAIAAVRSRTGGEPTTRAIAAELGMTDDCYALALDELADVGDSRIEVVMAAPGFGDIQPDGARKPDAKSAIADGITRLPEIQRALFELHYGEEISLEDAAEQIGITSGEARRLHTESIHRLRATLR